MKKFGVESIVGIFIIAGLLCLAYISIYLGKINLFGTGNNTYQVKAVFSSVTGLKEHTHIKIAGLRVRTATNSHLTINRPESTLQVRMTLN